MLFIVNPISGTKSKSSLINTLKATGHNVVCTEYAGQAEKLAREAEDDIVVAVGGDGTVNEVARGLIGTGKTLGIIPRGSGDGLALHLGLSHNTKKALKTIEAGKTNMMDAATVNDRFFFSVCGIGFDAQVSERFAKSGKRGIGNYLEQAFRTWIRFNPEECLINIDGQEWKSKPVLITIGNSDQWGNGARITPNADSNDAMLDITILDKPNNVEIPVLAYRIMTGTIYNDHRVHWYRGRNIIIKREKPGPAHIAGEYFHTGTTLDIRIIPDALKVIVP